MNDAALFKRIGYKNKWFWYSIYDISI